MPSDKNDFLFEAGDAFLRRIPPNRSNSQGRPSRSAFQGADNETSVYLRRLLVGGRVPSRQPGDDLAEFPVAWVLDPKIAKAILHVRQDDGAHFVIIGQLPIEFRDYLRDHSIRISAEKLDPVEFPSRQQDIPLPKDE